MFKTIARAGNPCVLRRCCSAKVGPTIFALSSGKCPSALAVFRISGSQALAVVNKMAGLNNNAQLIPRKAMLRKLVDPVTEELLDHGLVLWFPRPKSYTGEDLVELHVHGGLAVVSSITNALNKLPGFRMAEPGEFTKRAFLAGKMDATEVEGLADLLKAETEAQRRQALKQASGELAALYNQWRASMLLGLAHLEAFVDFGEDQDLDHHVLDSLQESMKLLMHKITDHLNDNRRGERLRNGVNVAIIGEPNVGKSSLLNILSRRNVAIVSPYAGTTRDVLEISLDVGGYPIVLCDTAGLRLSDDPVEAEGLKRARQTASAADLVIIVMDATRLPHPSLYPSQCTVEEFVREQCQRLCVPLGAETDRMLLINKTDLVDLSSGWITWIESPAVCSMSCKTEKGLSDFLTRLQSKLEKLCANPQEEPPLITSSRQRHHLQRALNHLISFTEILAHEQGDLALAGERLRKAARQIGYITAGGRIGTEEVLDLLFRSFCIGK